MSEICFVIKGLNQIYRHKKKIYSHHSQLLNLSNEIITQEDFMFMKEKDIINIITDNQLKLIICIEYYNISEKEEAQFLSVEERILSLSNLNKYFEFKSIKTLNEEIIKSPEKYVIFNEDIRILLKYKNLNCFTSLNTVLFYSFLEKSDTYVDEILASNLSQLVEKKLKNQITFQTIHFFQLKNLIPLINKNFTINSSKAKKVLILFRLLPKTSDFSKYDFNISNKDILYISHLGGNDVDLNNCFTTISVRITDFQDLIKYKELYSSIESSSYNMTNEIKHIRPFLYRDDMSQLLINFVSTVKNDEGIKLLFPMSINVKVKDLITDISHIHKLMIENNILLPIIVKYNSNNKEDNHLLTLIVNDEGLLNFIDYFKERNDDSLYCIIQQFHNHRGVFAKTFCINYEYYIFLRESFPDIPSDLIERSKIYPKGLLFINTKQLNSQYLKKLSLNEEMTSIQLADHKIDISYLNSITKKFVEYSKINLLSLDFVVDQDKQHYYILDCNYYPAYKEIKNEIGSKLAHHHLNN